MKYRQPSVIGELPVHRYDLSYGDSAPSDMIADQLDRDNFAKQLASYRAAYPQHNQPMATAEYTPSPPINRLADYIWQYFGRYGYDQPNGFQYDPSIINYMAPRPMSPMGFFDSPDMGARIKPLILPSGKFK